LNPNFRYITETSRALGKHVIDRCNLTVLSEDGQQDLADFLATHEVEIIASLPCYSEPNVDGQRGRGVFNKSIRALQRLNDLGYGRPDSALQLNLVYNPGAAFLPPPQAALETQYRTELQDQFGIAFNQLFTLTNLPINRFADYLERRGEAESYMQLLVDNFNPETVPHVMCRSLVSVDWQGGIYDCDFNQMVHLPTPHTNHHKAFTSIWDLESLDTMVHAPIATGHHCFGCTAGAGSSCGGALS
jgi:radical SAM/Cys-rich protein